MREIVIIVGHRGISGCDTFAVSTNDTVDTVCNRIQEAIDHHSTFEAKAVIDRYTSLRTIISVELNEIHTQDYETCRMITDFVKRVAGQSKLVCDD